MSSETDTMLIELEFRNTYGRNLYYPANDTAELVAKLLGKKVIDEKYFSTLKDLGYTLELVPTIQERVKL